MDQDEPSLKPISQLLQPLIGSSKNSTLSTSLSAKTDPVTAVERAKLLAGCYRKDDAADPETYAGAVAAVLAEYPPDVVQRVTDPRSGLPSRLSWLPTVKEVREACEEIDGLRRRTEQATAREREQIATRKREHEARKQRPTLTELQDQYGPNWGLKEENRREAIKAQRLAHIKDANWRMFAKECERAGLSPDSPISPSLAAAMRQKEWMR